MSVVEPFVEALHRGGVGHVIVGGVATVLHGFRIARKRLAGRPEDLRDIEALEAIARRQGGNDGGV